MSYDGVPVASGYLGSGSDGVVTISGTTTLTRDMEYSTLTVTGTGILKCQAFRVRCTGTITVASGGVIRTQGTAASGSSAGTGDGSGNGTLAPNLAGGNGQLGVGSNGVAATISFGGAGGAGGAGSGGAGGAGGTVTAPTTSQGLATNLATVGTGYFEGIALASRVAGGGGGAGGGGDGASAGGGGGAAGGTLLIAAQSIINNGTISANGTAGADGPGANRGGGGGGGGGVVFLMCMVKPGVDGNGNAATASGGAGGASGGGSGVAGSAGSAGVVYWCQPPVS